MVRALGLRDLVDRLCLFRLVDLKVKAECDR